MRFGVLLALLFCIPLATASLVIDGQTWATQKEFTPLMETEEWKFTLQEGEVTFLVRHVGHSLSTLDSFVLTDGKNKILPFEATQIHDDVLKKISSKDKDVVSIEEPVKIRFKVPKASLYTLKVTANEYLNPNYPTRIPGSNYVTAPLFPMILDVDGVEDFGLPLQTPISASLTHGRPSSPIYYSFTTDGYNIYGFIEVTGDNIDHIDERTMLLLYVPRKGFTKIFLEDAVKSKITNRAEVVRTFGYTDKVSWEHAVYEFKIPLPSRRVKEIKFALEYY